MLSMRASGHLFVIHSHVARTEFLLIHQADFKPGSFSNRKVFAYPDTSFPPRINTTRSGEMHNIRASDQG